MKKNRLFQCTYKEAFRMNTDITLRIQGLSFLKPFRLGLTYLC